MTTVNSHTAPTPPPRGPDDDLVVRAVGGDEQALADLLPRLRDDTYAVIRRIPCQAPGAATDDDVYQGGVVHLHKNIKKFNLLGSPFIQFRSWALRIFKNLAIDRLRTAKTNKETALHADVQFVDTRVNDPAAIAEINDLVPHMFEALEQLDPLHRELLHLRYVEGWSVPEIQQWFACNGQWLEEYGETPTPDALYGKCRRLREELRAKLDEGGR